MSPRPQASNGVGLGIVTISRQGSSKIKRWAFLLALLLGGQVQAPDEEEVLYCVEQVSGGLKEKNGDL